MSDARSSRRSSRRSSAPIEQPDESLHPHTQPIDVSSWSADDIKARLDYLGDREDFVNVDDK